ncbi:hypothetical protein GRI89_14345 [Altererythrobacter salegens]|uniref:O-antigen ligase-related domain-containing protein n=1 Tax=Croceibacterium salegens TaxID=1737568 RepID=A0A6I4SZA0_9SPHN|nr:O-antigen ligase family protein [Croceibacterium salegens]MXO60719.1 hypothetical protein [Croceibacterium salegens]
MRYIAIAFVLLALPIFVVLLRNRGAYKWAAFLIGLLPFAIGAANLDAALIDWSMWPGYAKGMVFTILDSLAISIVISSRHPFRRLPFKAIWATYLAAVALSAFQAELILSPLFYLFQLARVFVLFVAVASILDSPYALRYLMFGLAAGAIMQAGIAIDQRLGGAFQATGTMGHQNLLGLMLHFVTLPIFAFLLTGQKSKFLYLGLSASLLAVALGASRGAIGFVGLGVISMLFLSMLRRVTGPKLKVAGVFALMIALTGPLVLSGLERRFENLETAGGYDERAAFEKAAKSMWSDHPFGVGANEYVVVANTAGYNANAGVIWNASSRSTNVHNVYLLVGAETGWLGFATFVALLAWPVFRGLNYAFSRRKDPRGDIVLGATIAIAITMVHGLYEWVHVMYQEQYMMAIGLGIVAGAIRQRTKEVSASVRNNTAPSLGLAGLREDTEMPGVLSNR